eukprot:2604005-Amphidinium_carterae.1
MYGCCQQNQHMLLDAVVVWIRFFKAYVSNWIGAKRTLQASFHAPLPKLLRFRDTRAVWKCIGVPKLRCEVWAFFPANSGQLYLGIRMTTTKQVRA